MEGVANSLEDEVSFSTDKSGTNHPLAEISRSWGDSRLNASFETILFSLKHPYCNFLFDKNSVKLGDLEANTRVIGLRAGRKWVKDNLPPVIKIAWIFFYLSIFHRSTTLFY